MKKIILSCLALTFICVSIFIILEGKNNNEKTANYKNIKQSLRHLVVRIKEKEGLAPLYSLPTADALLLLLPDNNENPIFAQAWKNVALEEGLHLVTMSDSNFLDLTNNSFQGIILADTIHKDISPELSNKLINYVSTGGSLMLVYDAGTVNQNNSTSKRYPLMSMLLGINCGKQDILQGCLNAIGTIGNNVKTLSSLGVPPGKCLLADSNDDANSDSDAFCAISSVGFGELRYTHYVIKGADESSLLLTTPDHQLIAAVKPFGKGRVLYINLPLTYLWSQTDSMFLHLFIHYFASNMLHLPLLATVPNGVGGIIMNLHVESIDALAGFKILQNNGLFQQGPYSIDFTAGPGLDDAKDHRGMDVLNNSSTQYWIKYLAQLGNAIGSDGGWLHNYFGDYASESNQAEFQNLIKINNEAVESVLGQNVLEYVPSMGNQPSWAIRYLESQHFLGYYSTANTGAAPTQHFSKGIFDKDNLWSFPVLPFKNGACFRDFGRIGYSVPSVTQWLLDSTHFVASRSTSRLIYFHPSDILFFSQYLTSLKSWLSLAKQLQQQGDFQWYSMVDLAQFLNERRQVTWNVEFQGNNQIIKASHPQDIKNQSWILSKDKCNKPQITEGVATIKEKKYHWIVQAGRGQKLEFSCRVITK